MIRLPRFWRRHFLTVEFLLAVVVAAGFAVWYLRFNGAAAMTAALQGNRATLYGTLASILGSLLGFVITATSIVLGFSTSERLAVVRESTEYPTLWKTFGSTIWTLALSTIVSLLCLVFDRDSSPNRWFAIPFVFVLLLSLLRISRTIWVLERIIALVTKPVRKDSIVAAIRRNK